MPQTLSGSGDSRPKSDRKTQVRPRTLRSQTLFAYPIGASPRRPHVGSHLCSYRTSHGWPFSPSRMDRPYRSPMDHQATDSVFRAWAHRWPSRHLVLLSRSRRRETRSSRACLTSRMASSAISLSVDGTSGPPKRCSAARSAVAFSNRIRAAASRLARASRLVTLNVSSSLASQLLLACQPIRSCGICYTIPRNPLRSN